MTEATDVLILTTHHGAGTVEEFRSDPPAGDPPVALGRGLTVEQLPFEDAEEIMDGCEPRGMDPPAKRQFGQRNALVRRRAPQAEQLVWDPDATIATALALSRYVLPNAHGVEYAARLIVHGEERRRMIPLGWEARFQAYVPNPSQRDWLDQGEAESLRDLLAVFWRVRDVMPQRVVRAIWLCEYGSRLRYIDVAWINTVTALEALLNTGRRQLRRQFVTRATAVAAEVGMSGFDTSQADEAYSLRSEAVHGAGVTFRDDPAAAERFGRLQRLLQVALRRAIEDDSFRSAFASADTVRTRWPVDPS